MMASTLRPYRYENSVTIIPVTKNIDANITFTTKYLVEYVGNVFYTQPRTESGLTIDYNPYTESLHITEYFAAINNVEGKTYDLPLSD